MINDEALFASLQKIQNDIGRIAESSETTRDWLNQHIQEDKKLSDRVTSLERRADEQHGAARFATLVLSALGAVGGALITLFVRHPR